MDKKIIALVVVVCVVVFSIGIFAGRFVTPIETSEITLPPYVKTPIATSSPEITLPPYVNEERELLKQWLQMHEVYYPEGDFYPEGDLGEIIHDLQIWDFHPIEIYRGSLIFYEKSYGYCYLPEMDSKCRRMPPDTYDDETRFVSLVKKHGGTTTEILEEGTCWAACFSTLSGAESFLTEFWSMT